MITIDDLMSYGGGVAVVPGSGGGGDGEATTPRRQMVAVDDDHQLTVTRIRAAVSMLGRRRTGHARFRRGPVVADPSPSSSDDHHRQLQQGAGVTTIAKGRDEEGAALSASASGASSSLPAASTTLTSSLTAGGEASMSNGRRFPPASGGHHAAGKPLPSAVVSMQQPASSDYCYNPAAAAPRGNKCHGRCHCSKRRKSRERQTVRVPAISSRNADIPPDDYSWRKYGQKPIKGSPYPRGYYKCSTVRGCPARKHVERDPAEPAMLIVTYDGDHRHHDRPGVAAAHLPEHTETTSAG